MSTAAELLKDPELLETEWDLAPLVDGDTEHGVRRLLDAATERATALAERYAGRIGELDAGGLAELMRELAALYDEIGKAGSYASLRFATDSADPTRGAMLQLVQERGTEIETKLIFVELEWAAVADERAEALLAAPELDFCAHYLRSARRYRPHLLTEPEEKILAEKSIASSAAWSRLFGEQMSAVRVDLDGEPQSLEVALSRLQSPDRELRRTVAEAVTRVAGSGAAYARVHLQHAAARQGRR